MSPNRSVYENRQKEEFMKRLEDRVKFYDSEIERLCSKNYQSFVETFNEFLSVREDTATLKVTLQLWLVDSSLSLLNTHR